MTGASQRRHEADLEHLRTCNADLRKQIEALRKDNQAAASKLSEKTRQLASVNTKLADLVPDIREAAIAVENDKKATPTKTISDDRHRYSNAYTVRIAWQKKDGSDSLRKVLPQRNLEEYVMETTYKPSYKIG
ncbi:hypothetical protein IWZ01DRAFT_545921 [Phyllosticta capitalensis]